MLVQKISFKEERMEGRKGGRKEGKKEGRKEEGRSTSVEGEHLHT